MMTVKEFFEEIETVKAVLYTRISKDEDREGESIDLQMRVNREFCDEKGIIPLETISDNNVSGYNFKTRLGLKRLMKMVEDGECNTVIAKDLSRLGRNQAHTLLLLDFFKEHGVRLLLIGENYDSDADDDGMIAIKAWLNEMYIKDISRKTTKFLLLKLLSIKLMVGTNQIRPMRLNGTRLLSGI